MSSRPVFCLAGRRCGAGSADPQTAESGSVIRCKHSQCLSNSSFISKHYIACILLHLSVPSTPPHRTTSSSVIQHSTPHHSTSSSLQLLALFPHTPLISLPSHRGGSPSTRREGRIKQREDLLISVLVCLRVFVSELVHCLPPFYFLMCTRPYL